MLEDEDYEVTYDPPELQAQGLVEAELSPTDIQLKGGEGLRIRPGSFCDCSYPPCVRETPPDAWRLGGKDFEWREGPMALARPHQPA